MSCPECFTGAIMTTYQPKGELITLHNRQTYIARPSINTTPKGIIVIISDAFGLPFPNTKHLADTYASHDFLTYLPDFMDGHYAPQWLVYTFPRLLSTATWSDWLWKPYDIVWTLWAMAPFVYHNGFATSMPKVTAFLEAVRENEAAEQNLPIGAAGFCWGGQHVFALASGLKSEKTGKLLCDAGFTAHPSNVAVPGDAQKVARPISIAAATGDKVMTLSQTREVEAILKRKEEEGVLRRGDWDVKYYEGANHGFAVRADPMNKEVVTMANEAVEQAVGFFGGHFELFRSGASN